MINNSKKEFKEMIGIFILIIVIFIGIWILAAKSIAKKTKSKITSVGGGFIITCIISPIMLIIPSLIFSPYSPLNRTNSIYKTQTMTGVSTNDDNNSFERERQRIQQEERNKILALDKEFIDEQNGMTRIRELIRNGQIELGMTKAQVIQSWGSPDHINKYGTETEQWVYRKNGSETHYIYIRNGIMDNMQSFGLKP